MKEGIRTIQKIASFETIALILGTCADEAIFAIRHACPQHRTRMMDIQILNKFKLAEQGRFELPLRLLVLNP